jgi:hypothetical protein
MGIIRRWPKRPVERMEGARRITSAVTFPPKLSRPWSEIGAAFFASPRLRFRSTRAPGLTLWATVVAEHLGHSPDAALVLGRYVCGASARLKARRIGVAGEGHEAEERLAQAALKPDREFVRLLGLDVPVMRGRRHPADRRRRQADISPERAGLPRPRLGRSPQGNTPGDRGWR